jgi:FG-GAP repeat
MRGRKLILLLVSVSLILILFTACKDTPLKLDYKSVSIVYNWDPQRTLTAGGGTEYNYFGTSCDIDGEYIIVGAPHWDLSSCKVYIYTYDNWSNPKIITGSGSFGNSVSIHGDYSIVGDYYNDAAYIYKRSGTDWILQRTLSENVNSDFGNSVSIYGHYAIVGAYTEQVGGLSGSGKAYIYYKDQGGTDNWGRIHDLQCSDSPATNLEFGWDVSISEKYAIVSTKKYASDQGAVYIYNKVTTDQWGTGSREEHYRLIPFIQFSGDYFGESVAIDGNTAIVGYGGQEKAIVYKNTGIEWISQVITAPKPISGNGFGNAVAASGEYVAVGPYKNNGVLYTGSIPMYVFEYIDGIWFERPPSDLPNNSSNVFFITSVGISGDRAICGISSDDSEGEDAGAAVVFSRIESKP